MADTLRFGKWEAVREIGGGGQAKVHLAFDTTKYDPGRVFSLIHRYVNNLAHGGTADANRENAFHLLKVIEAYIRRESGDALAAVKVLNLHGDHAAKARERLAVEVETLSAASHRHLVTVLDADVAAGWFAMPYYGEGTLASARARFAGRPIEALEAFRGLLDAAFYLHEQGKVHRDIKPENIFVNGNDLVLGDLGITFDPDETRLTDTYDNVGSRDWEPPWAMGRRLDVVRPSFDVFCLGKLLWSMVAGRTKLPLWYFKDAEFDLERQFPGDARMEWINRLLAGAIVEREADIGWPTAQGMLEQVDSVLRILRNGGRVMNQKTLMGCVVCGRGPYVLALGDSKRLDRFQEYGLQPVVGGARLRVYKCQRCGNVQVFDVRGIPAPWGPE